MGTMTFAREQLDARLMTLLVTQCHHYDDVTVFPPVRLKC